MIVGVRVPFFTAHVQIAGIPSLNGVPVVVLGGRGMSESAARAGITSDMSESRARTLAPNVQFVHYTSTKQTLACNKVESILADYSHQVEHVLHYDSQWFVGLGKLRPTDAFKLGTDMLQQLSDKMNLPSSVGVSEARITADIASRVIKKHQILFIPPGSEASFLAPHPASLLPLPKKIHQNLKHLGIRTIGDFADLPRQSVLEQWGQVGLKAYKLAHGIDFRPVATAQARQVEVVMHDFKPATDDGILVEETISKLARTVAAQLKKKNLEGSELTLAINFENHQITEQTIVLGHKTYNTAAIRQHLLNIFARIPITAAVESIIVSVDNLTVPNAFQPGLFDQHIKNAETFKDTLKHLVHKYGEQCFYQITIANPHERVPERRFRLDGIDFP